VTRIESWLRLDISWVGHKIRELTIGIVLKRLGRSEDALQSNYRVEFDNSNNVVSSDGRLAVGGDDDDDLAVM
jgi:hypothetical protein